MIVFIKSPVFGFLYVILFLFSGIFQVGKATRPATFGFKTIVIDPGHGGKDPGAHGGFSLEKNVVLSIGEKLQKAIHAELPGVKVIMTRSTDRFIELNRRSEIANEHHASLFISLHCNSSPELSSREARQKGVLVLVYGYHRKEEQMEAIRENASIYQEKNYRKKYSYGKDASVDAIIYNAYLQKYRRQSIYFADLLLHEFKKHDKRKAIGLKEQGVLVLARTASPSVLVETGFINNPTEERYLNSAKGQDEIVQSILRAVKKYRLRQP